MLFSKAYSAFVPVAAGRTVDWCGFILGLPSRPPPAAVVVFVAPVRNVAILAVSDICVDASEAPSSETGGSFPVSADEGCGSPVSAVQISAIGGSASVQGIVNNGLSHRPAVLGSS